jgi:hypothetical protein
LYVCLGDANKKKEKEKKHVYDGSYTCFGGERKQQKKHETCIQIVCVFWGVVKFE